MFTGWEPVHEKSSRQFSAHRRHLEELFRAGVNRKDVGKEVIPELGFRVALLSGPNDFGPIKLAITAGCYSKCLSENPRCPQRNDSELKMQEADVICDFLLPPYQQSSRPVKPGEGGARLSNGAPCGDGVSALPFLCL